MKQFLAILLSIFAVACSTSQASNPNTNVPVFKRDANVTDPDAYRAQYAANEQRKKELDDFHRKMGELEANRKVAVEQCKSARYKNSYASSGAGPDSPLSCEEMNPPVQ